MESRSNDSVREELQHLLDFLRDLADGNDITLTGAQLREWILLLEMVDCLLEHLETKE